MDSTTPKQQNPTERKVIFRLATSQDTESLLQMINQAYAISEKFMWKPGTVRTNTNDVNTIATKTFDNQDVYILLCDESDPTIIIGSIRYEPRIELYSNDIKTIIRLRDFIGPTESIVDQVENFYKTFCSTQQQIQQPIISSSTTTSSSPYRLRIVGHFSQFVINPAIQRGGFGSKVIAHIEQLTTYIASFVTKQFQLEDIQKVLLPIIPTDPIQFDTTAKMEMIVLSPRQDMIDFYTKRGYSHCNTLPPEPYMHNDVLQEFQDLVELEYEKVLM